MKNSLHLLKAACLAAVTLLVVSCCGGSRDYRDMLPADAFITMSMNPASLCQKSNCGDIEQSLFYPRIKEQIEGIGSLSDDQKAYYLSLLKDPSGTGIDLSRDMFYFMSMDGASAVSMQPFIGCLFPLGDKAKFDDFVARVNSMSGTAVETDGGISVVKISEQGGMTALLAYDDSACLFAFSQDAYNETLKRVKDLFSQKRSESLLADKAIAEQLSGKNDINAVLSYAGMSTLMNSNPMLSSLPVMEALKDVVMVGSMNFEKGRIVSETAFVFRNGEAEKKLMDFYSYMKPQKGNLLEYIPANSIGMISFGMNGEKLYEMVAALPGYAMLAANPMVKQVLGAFDGDFAIAFSGMAPGGSYPIASVLARVDGPAIMKTIVANLGGMPLQTLGEGEYLFNMGGVSAFFGVKDDLLYITTDAAVKSALDGTKFESLASMGKIVDGKTGTFYLDFKGLNNLLAQVFAYQAETQQVQAAMSVLALFDDLEAYGTMKGGTMIVNMENKEQNALETICKKTGEMIRQYMQEANM